MKFPWSYKELNKIFLNAHDPDIDDFQGEYIVDILSWLPSFKSISHRKVIYTEGNRHYGHNVFPCLQWGQFLLTEKTLKESGDIKTLMLSYDLMDNFYLIKNIRDYIRCIDKNTLYIGKFYYQIFGYPVFIGYFSLEKIK
jgi:hypothetical protein